MAGQFCQSLGDSANGAGVCTDPECDLIMQSGCADGEGCYLADPSTGSGVCATAGTGGDGDSCSSATDCQGGFGCAGSPAACRAWCNPASPTCDTGYNCAHLTNSSGDPIPGVGVCVPSSSM